VQEGDFDAIVAYSSAVAPYCLEITELPKVADMVDVDSLKWEAYAGSSKGVNRWIYGLEAARLRVLERSILQSFDATVVSTRREQDQLRSEGVSQSISTVRNGVCVDEFASDGSERAQRPTLVFTGQMDYLPNVEAAALLAQEVMPGLRSRIPELEFLIVGRSPTPRVKRLARLPGVIVTGEVAEIRPYLASAWVFVAPLQIARGIQNKVLEALAAGLPVVCSAAVMSGLEDGGLEAGEDLLVANSPEEWSTTIRDLLESPTLRADLSANAREKLSKAYSWEANIADLERIIARSVEGRGGATEEVSSALLQAVGKRD
jgi:sugar transferase (PEP-CTERM/EpsH1 system associated)